MDTSSASLTGTDKQVAWALDIREQAGRLFDQLRKEMDAGVAAHPDKAEQAAVVIAAVETAFASHTDAAWWCDHGAAARSVGMHLGSGAFAAIRSEAYEALTR